MTIKVLATLSALAMLAACASQSRTEADFGTSVNVVTNAQVYDEAAALYPDSEAVLGGDPDQLNNAVEGHRKESAGTASTQSPVNINIGRSGN